MKNILFVLLVILSLNADEFKFDPKIDSINDLKRFCSKNKHGVDLVIRLQGIICAINMLKRLFCITMKSAIKII